MLLKYDFRGGLKDIGPFGSFSQRAGPPPFGRAPSKKYFRGISGPKEHFWFSQKSSAFVSIVTYTFGNRGPLPLHGKIPK